MVVCVNDDGGQLTDENGCSAKKDANCVWMTNWPKARYYCSVADMDDSAKWWCTDAKVDITNVDQGICFKDNGNVAAKVEKQVGKVIDGRKLINDYSCEEDASGLRKCVQHSVECDPTKYFVNGKAYAHQIDVGEGISREEAEAICTEEAKGRDFFYQQHLSGHTICGFYTEKLEASDAGNAFENQGIYGGVCRIVTTL